MSEERQEFKTGAARSKIKGRPDLIPKAAIEAMGRRLELGTKYGENNWRLGGEDFRKATIAHLQLHLADYNENGNRDDANTDAIICNAAFLCQYELDAPFPGAARVVEDMRGRDAKTSAITCDATLSKTAALGCQCENCKAFVANNAHQLDAINARIRRVLGESDRRTHAQQADAIVKELFQCEK